MRIDAHQHFWSYSAAEYPWIGPHMGVLRRDFLPGHLAAELGRCGLAGSVGVQARQSLEESRWLLRLAAENPRVLGVVGWVDLRSAEVERQLEELSGQPKFVGVRHVVQDEPDDRFMLGSDFLRGLGCLRRFGLVYDVLIYPRQLPAAIELANRLPEQPLVLDHLAKPQIRDGLMSPWREQVRELARHPNICCKVSGMVTEANWKGWTAAQLRPYLDVVFEAFGSERLLYGSDWPVCLLAAEYGQVWEVVREYVEPLGPAARAAVLGGNAARVYGLKPPPGPGAG